MVAAPPLEILSRVCSYLWKDVGDCRDEDVGAADASLDQAPQSLPALQPRPAVHDDDAELPSFLKGLKQDVVDQRRADGDKTKLNVEGRKDETRTGKRKHKRETVTESLKPCSATRRQILQPRFKHVRLKCLTIHKLG